MDRRPKRKPRQLALTEQGQQIPRWATLPEECRQQVVALIARMLRSELAADEEMDDE